MTGEPKTKTIQIGGKSMHLGLEGKKALVCGASSGIGLAIAQQLYREGCHVTLCARNEEKLQQAKTFILSQTSEAHPISTDHNSTQLGRLKDFPKNETPIHDRIDWLTADFSDPLNLDKNLREYLSKHKMFDIIINNSGGPPPGPAQTATSEQFEAAFKQHLLCNQVIALQVIGSMKQQKFGRIINIISTSVKQPIDNLGVSNTIRGAVANWSKTLANELGPFGITVNNLLPGATSTGRLSQIIERKAKAKATTYEAMEIEEKTHIPIGRFAEPEEIASAVVFLASERASYITGINLTVDGGRTGCL